MHRLQVFAIVALLATAGACTVQYVDLGVSSGKQGYIITCVNDFARCERQAAELCPDGFEQTKSQRVGKHDQPALTSGALIYDNDKEYQLTIECDATDK